jgi:hypothetical protein
MSKANDSTQKLTVDIHTVDVKAITSTEFTDLKTDNASVSALKIKTAYLNYAHPNGRDRNLQVRFPWIEMTSGGVAKEDALYYKDTLQIPLTDNDVISKLQEMDSYFDTEEFKNKLFKSTVETGKKSANKKTTNEYSKLIRSAYTSDSGKEYPPTLIIKVDMKNPKLKLQLYKSEDKKTTPKEIPNVNTVNDVREHITYKSTIRPIVKFTNFQCSNNVWKPILKLVGCTIIPYNKASTNDPVTGCDFVSDDETADASASVVVPNVQVIQPKVIIKPATKGTAKVQANVTSDEDDENEARNKALKVKAKAETLKKNEDTDNSDDDDEVVVTKKPALKGNNKRNATTN